MVSCLAPWREVITKPIITLSPLSTPWRLANVAPVCCAEDCKQTCREEATCQGIEYAYGRCEVWTRPEGIGALDSTQDHDL